MLEQVQLEHAPSTHTVHLVLFRDVTNAAYLHQQLLSRNAAFEYAFIDAATVVSRFHLLAAVFKAVSLHKAAELKTPNVHSEVVCALSSNKNISEAYRRFGIQAATRDVVVVKVSVAEPGETCDASATEAVERHLRDSVQGQCVPVTDAELGALTDWARLRKYHKLGGAAGMDGMGCGSGSGSGREREMLVVGAMALRGL